MPSVKISYPGTLRDDIDAFANSLPGWYASGYSIDEDIRDHAVDVPDNRVATAIELILHSCFARGSDVKVVYREEEYKKPKILV